MSRTNLGFDTEFIIDIERWQYFSWFGLLVVTKNGRLSGWDAPTKKVSGTIRSTLNEIEGVLIAATEPAFNKQGAKFRGITRYRQVAHSDAEHFSFKQLREFLSEITVQVADLKRALEGLSDERSRILRRNRDKLQSRGNQ